VPSVAHLNRAALFLLVLLHTIVDVKSTENSGDGCACESNWFFPMAQGNKTFGVTFQGCLVVPSLGVDPFCVVSAPCASSQWSANLERHWMPCDWQTPIARTVLSEDEPEVEPLAIAYRGRVADTFLVPRQFLEGHYVSDNVAAAAVVLDQTSDSTGSDTSVVQVGYDIQVITQTREDVAGVQMVNDNTAADVVTILQPPSPAPVPQVPAPAPVPTYVRASPPPPAPAPASSNDDDDDDDNGDDGNVYGGYRPVDRDSSYNDYGYDGIFNLECAMYLLDWHCNYQTIETNINGACSWSGTKCITLAAATEAAEVAESDGYGYDGLYNLACNEYLIDWHCEYQTAETNAKGACSWFVEESQGKCIDESTAAANRNIGTTYRPAPYNAEQYAAETRKNAKKEEKMRNAKREPGVKSSYTGMMRQRTKSYSTSAAFFVGMLVVVLGYTTFLFRRDSTGAVECVPVTDERTAILERKDDANQIFYAEQMEAANERSFSTLSNPATPVTPSAV